MSLLFSTVQNISLLLSGKFPVDEKFTSFILKYFISSFNDLYLEGRKKNFPVQNFCIRLVLQLVSVDLPWYRIPLSGAFFSLAYWTKRCLVAWDEAEWWLFLQLIVSAAIIKHSNQYMTFLWYSELLLLIGYLHCVNNRWNIEKKVWRLFDPKWPLFGIYAINSWLGCRY